MFSKSEQDKLQAFLRDVEMNEKSSHNYSPQSSSEAEPSTFKNTTIIRNILCLIREN